MAHEKSALDPGCAIVVIETVKIERDGESVEVLLPDAEEFTARQLSIERLREQAEDEPDEKVRRSLESAARQMEREKARLEKRNAEARALGRDTISRQVFRLPKPAYGAYLERERELSCEVEPDALGRRNLPVEDLVGPFFEQAMEAGGYSLGAVSVDVGVRLRQRFTTSLIPSEDRLLFF